ncbi:MAG: nitroreductase family protein [Clostridia bacterium]|nr:nitroreductase family protein [Clostridia bacterium]
MITNETLRLIASRRSHRAYTSTPLTQEQIDALLKAAVEAPSAVNRQPWHFSLVRNQKLLDEINGAVREGMMKKAPEKRSPRLADEKFHVFYHAPAVIFLSAQPGNAYSPIDCGIAVQNIALAAESMGLGSVILGMPREAFQTDKADALRRALDFPEGYDFVIAISVGIPVDDKEAHAVGEGKISFVD